MLTATVRGQQLQLRTPLIVADSINYITARFAFDKDWDGRNITAFFVQKDTVISALVQNNEITAEQGINLTAGIWELKLTGVKGDSRITAGSVKINVLPFGTIDGDLPDISLTQHDRQPRRPYHGSERKPCCRHKRSGNHRWERRRCVFPNRRNPVLQRRHTRR